MLDGRSALGMPKPFYSAKVQTATSIHSFFFQIISQHIDAHIHVHHHTYALTHDVYGRMNEQSLKKKWQSHHWVVTTTPRWNRSPLALLAEGCCSCRRWGSSSKLGWRRGNTPWPRACCKEFKSNGCQCPNSIPTSRTCRAELTTGEDSDRLSYFCSRVVFYWFLRVII